MQPASALLIALIALGSAGCGAASRQSLPVPPAVLTLPDCPAPARPPLARIDGARPLDAPGNVEALLERDDTLRLHVEALEAAITCYRRRKAPASEK